MPSDGFSTLFPSGGFLRLAMNNKSRRVPGGIHDKPIVRRTDFYSPGGFGRNPSGFSFTRRIEELKSHPMITLLRSSLGWPFTSLELRSSANGGCDAKVSARQRLTSRDLLQQP